MENKKIMGIVIRVLMNIELKYWIVMACFVIAIPFAIKYDLKKGKKMTFWRFIGCCLLGYIVSILISLGLDYLIP